MGWPALRCFARIVRPESGHSNWRDAEAYAALLEVERAGHAWEWLRRDPRYQAAAASWLGSPGGSVRAEQPEAALWGLHAFEDPSLGALAARPVWRAARHGPVLAADAEPALRDGDSLCLDRLAGLATLVDGGGSEHLLLCDGRRSVRLDVQGTSLTAGPVRLSWRISGLASAQAPLLVLRRLIALARTGRFAPGLHPPERRARRLVLLLRTHDALAAGTSQREIAAWLISSAAAGSRWRVETPSLRSRAQRLVRGAAAMAAGGWEALLR